MKLLILLVLFSCSHSSNWQVEHLYSDYIEHCSNKLSYVSKDRMSGMNLEILCIGNNIKAYLHFSHMIKQPAVIVLTTPESTEQFSAYCLRGGQKILLSQEALRFLYHALENNQAVQISIGGYQSLIEPTGFQENLKKLQTLPTTINPFQFSL